MTKYTAKFKTKLVKEYQNGKYSTTDISKIYGVSTGIIYRWKKQVEINGYGSLARRAKRNRYTQKFKVNVVKYYKTHDEGYDTVAALFKISPTQVQKWNTDYNNDGITALREKKRGCPPMNRKIKRKSSLSKTKEEKYQEQITDLQEQLFYKEMELDIRKKLTALRKEEQRQPK